MSAPAWTPGPWTSLGWSKALDAVTISAGGLRVASAHYLGGTEQAKANGRLISAAPDMADVCAELRRLSLVIESAVRYADPDHDDAIWALIRANDAALARARGEPHPAASPPPARQDGGER